MPVSKERNRCQQRGKEMVPGSVSGAAPDEDSFQQELCAFFSLSVPLVRVKLGPILIETSKTWGRGNAGIFYW